MKRQPIKLEIQGAIEARENNEDALRKLTGQRFIDALRSGALWVERDAKRNAPVDTGRLKGSIASKLTANYGGGLFKQTAAIVGSNVTHAPFQELGTGTFVGRPPHRVPVRFLRTWAGRAGRRMNPYLVARAIFQRGGLRPKKYLERAFNSNKERIQRTIGAVVRAIIQEANK